LDSVITERLIFELEKKNTNDIDVKKETIVSKNNDRCLAQKGNYIECKDIYGHTGYL